MNIFNSAYPANTTILILKCPRLNILGQLDARQTSYIKKNDTKLSEIKIKEEKKITKEVAGRDCGIGAGGENTIGVSY